MRYGLLCACVCWRYCGVGEERLLEKRVRSKKTLDSRLYQQWLIEVFSVMPMAYGCRPQYAISFTGR